MAGHYYEKEHPPTFTVQFNTLSIHCKTEMIQYWTVELPQARSFLSAPVLPVK